MPHSPDNRGHSTLTCHVNVYLVWSIAGPQLTIRHIPENTSIQRTIKTSNQPSIRTSTHPLYNQPLNCPASSSTLVEGENAVECDPLLLEANWSVTISIQSFSRTPNFFLLIGFLLNAKLNPSSIDQHWWLARSHNSQLFGNFSFLAQAPPFSQGALQSSSTNLYFLQ